MDERGGGEGDKIKSYLNSSSGLYNDEVIAIDMAAIVKGGLCERDQVQWRLDEQRDDEGKEDIKEEVGGNRCLLAVGIKRCIEKKKKRRCCCCLLLKRRWCEWRRTRKRCDVC